MGGDETRTLQLAHENEAGQDYVIGLGVPAGPGPGSRDPDQSFAKCSQIRATAFTTFGGVYTHGLRLGRSSADSGWPRLDRGMVELYQLALLPV